MRKPKKHRQYGHNASLPIITQRTSSASTIFSNATNDLSSSEQQCTIKTGAETTRRRRVRRVDCGVDNVPLPMGVFRRVLMFLSSKDIVHGCSLVCKGWLAMCRDQKLWQQKCEQECKYVPELMGPPPKNFMLLYFRNPYTTNLLCNTHGLDFWSQPRGCQIANVEESPEGAGSIRDHIPAEDIHGSIQNWVSSYRYTILSQQVVLLAEGCSKVMLDDLRPPIEVSVWCAAHCDAGAKFYLLVRLIDKRKKEAGRFEKELDLSYEAVPKVWHKVGHTFTEYKPGVRKVVFKMGGTDTVGWTGSFGAKFTLPCMRFVFQNPQPQQDSGPVGCMFPQLC